MTKPITVLLADDHMVVREGLRSLLKTERDIKVVGEADTGRNAVRLAEKLRPDIVIMDIAMPLLNGLEATRQILKKIPGVGVIILSAHSEHAYVDQALAFGASGFLIKQSSADILPAAIRAVRKGRRYFCPSTARRLRLGEPQAKRLKMAARLSLREAEIIQLVAEGKANKQVAAELDISVKTVEKHRQNLMAKLNIHDIAGLTRYAISAGIIQSSVQLTII